jgi:hypothetical protein
VQLSVKKLPHPLSDIVGASFRPLSKHKFLSLI